MQKSLLKEIVLEQEKDRKNLDRGIPRAALSVALRHAALPHTVVVSGVRRCGKSTLLNQVIGDLYRDGIYYLNFEDERLINFTVEDFNDLYEVFLELYGPKNVFFFDEIQNIPKWEVFVRNLKKVLGLGSMNTIKSYADYLENSYLIFLTSKFSYSLKEQEEDLRIAGKDIKVMPIYKWLLAKRISP